MGTIDWLEEFKEDIVALENVGNDLFGIVDWENADESLEALRPR